MRFSIIIPLYNTPINYFEKCINSICNQSFIDYEVIIIDDGSSDENTEAYKNLITNGKIKYIKKENGGVSSARNHAISMASGDYFLFIDADDWIEPNTLEFVNSNLADEDIFAFDAFIENQDLVELNFLFNKDIDCIEKEQIYKQIIWKYVNGPSLHLRNTFGTPWGKAYKNSLFKKDNVRFPLGVLVGEDAIFNLNAIKEATKISYRQKSLYHYRIASNSATTAKYNERRVKSDMFVADYFKKFVESNCNRDGLILASNCQKVNTLIQILKFKVYKKDDIKSLIEEYDCNSSIQGAEEIYFPKESKKFVRLLKNKKYGGLYFKIRTRRFLVNIYNKFFRKKEKIK